MGLVPELVELLSGLLALMPESVELPAALGWSVDPGCVGSGWRPRIPLVSLEPSAPALSASARPGALTVSASVRALLPLTRSFVRPPVALRLLVVSVPSVSMPVVSAPAVSARIVSAGIVSAPVVSIAPTRPGRALVSTPAAPEYPDVSGRATPAEEVS